MQRHAGQCFAYEERQGYIELVKSFKKKKKKKVSWNKEIVRNKLEFADECCWPISVFAWMGKELINCLVLWNLFHW